MATCHARGHATGTSRAAFSPHLSRDYRQIDHLDNYESEGLEEDVDEQLDEEGMFAARAAAERELDERSRRAGGGVRALDGGALI